MNQGGTLNVVPPTSTGCTVNFSPPIPLSSDSSNPLDKYNFSSGTAKDFILPTEVNSCSFNFSVDRNHGLPPVNRRSLPINKT
jgi:hypothetical protein